MPALRKYLPWVSLGLCTILAMLLIIDLMWPDLMLFLRPLTKLYVLITALAASGCGMLSVSQRRRAQRLAARQRRRR